MVDKTAPANGPFIVKPYLQLGDQASMPRSAGGVRIIWHATMAKARWSVLGRPVGAAAWSRAVSLTKRRILVPPVAAHLVYEAQLALPDGCHRFEYIVRREGVAVFRSEAIAPQTRSGPTRIVVVGDVGAGTKAERAIAFRIHEADPDLIVIPGDVVYQNGRISEYRRNLYPIYNADASSPERGAPLLRSRVVLPGLGWHDSTSDLAAHPDSLAFFMYWALPLTGPTHRSHDVVANGYGQVMAGNGDSPPLWGSSAQKRAIVRASGERYPRMAHYSVRLGDCHWIGLDTNEYVDWSEHDNQPLRDWLATELAKAQDASWRFVSCYLPPFNSSDANDVSHWTQTQKMRVIADILEAGRVDIVFSGYVHNYQRTAPLRFRRRPDARTVPAHARQYNTAVDGAVEVDGAFDGRGESVPDGIIYLVTGAGGNELHSSGQGRRTDSWQPYTVRFVTDRYSFTVMDVSPDRLRVRQLSSSGRELDTFEVPHAP